MGDAAAQNPIKPAMGNQVKTPNQNAPFSAHSQKAEYPSEIAFDESQLQKAAATNSPTGNTLGNLISCPYCSSKKVWRNAKRYTKSGGEVQRWLCRNCGYRFSESQPLKNSLDWPLNTGSATICKRQVCDILQESKNLAIMENPPKNGLTREATEQTADAKGKILEFAWWMKKQGYAEGTIVGRTKILTVLTKRGANLYDPETVKETISQQNWSEGRKENAVDAYTLFLKINGGSWNPPIYARVRKLPFIPTEKEIDALIASCGPKTAALLQVLKETAARVGEAWMLKWIDLDVENRTVRITPEKGSDPRMFKISTMLLSMLMALPKKSNCIFGSYPLHGFRTCYTRQRAKAARKLGNPRILQITFHTFRHWKATIEYAKTKDILYVMRLLGHKSIKNTLVYTQLIEFKADEFVCKAAQTVQEASDLIENGFEFVCAFDNAKLFRKRK